MKAPQPGSRKRLLSTAILIQLRKKHSMIHVVPHNGLRQLGAVLAALSLTLTLLFAASCSRPQAAAQEHTGATVEVPHFAIAVKLSDQAEKRLLSIGESVLVVAYFDGDALPGQGKHEPPNRDVVLGSDEKMVDGNNVARFDGSRVPLNDWNRLSDKNYFVTINTVSARKLQRTTWWTVPTQLTAGSNRLKTKLSRFNAG